MARGNPRFFFSEVSMDKLSLCNSALMRCGAEQITALTDVNKRASAVVNQYENTLKEILSDSPWNFAIKRIDLMEESTTPLFGAKFQYELPKDCIRVLEIESKVPYRVESGFIMTDQAGTINVKYVFYNKDACTYSGTFVKAFYLKLAEDISYLLVQSASLQSAITTEAERYLRKARSMNSQEGTPEARYPEDYTAGIRR